MVVAITSANHSNTRRNRVEVELRAAQAHLAADRAGSNSITVSIADVGETDRFDDHIVASVAANEAVCDVTGRPVYLTPTNCVVACSTPTVARQIAANGFALFAIEDTDSPLQGARCGTDVWHVARPWQLVESIAGAEGSLDQGLLFVEQAHAASQRIWGQDHLGRRIAALFDDPIVGGVSGCAATFVLLKAKTDSFGSCLTICKVPTQIQRRVSIISPRTSGRARTPTIVWDPPAGLVKILSVRWQLLA